MNRRTSIDFVIVANGMSLLFAGCTSGCVESNTCEAPGLNIYMSNDNTSGGLPSWALGEFGWSNAERHDITNFRLMEHGDNQRIDDDGDVVRCRVGRGSYQSGHIIIEYRDEIGTEASFYDFIRTNDGRYWGAWDLNNDLEECNRWTEYQHNSLCYNAVNNGCGNSYELGPCIWEKAAEWCLKNRFNSPTDGGSEN